MRDRLLFLFVLVVVLLGAAAEDVGATTLGTAIVVLGALTKLTITLLERPVVLGLLLRIVPDALKPYGPLVRFLLASALPVLVAFLSHIHAGLPLAEAVDLALGGIVTSQGFHLGPRALRKVLEGQR